MKRFVLLLAICALVAAASPILAGDHGDCDHDPADCAAKMAAKIQQKAWLGVELEEAGNGQYAITKVIEGSPAETAGFRTGDVLVSFNGIMYAGDTHDKIKQEWYALKPGSQASYVVARNGSKTKLSATLGHVPDAVLAEWVGEHILKAHTDVKLASK